MPGQANQKIVRLILESKYSALPVAPSSNATCSENSRYRKRFFGRDRSNGTLRGCPTTGPLQYMRHNWLEARRI
jgi:hypothetical protein